MLKKFRTIVIAVLPAFLINCAATSDQASKESILPEIDVVQVKEKAEEALRVIQQIKLEMPVITTKITDLDNRIIGVSEENQSASPARVEELETQIVLLTEAFKGMQAQVNTLQSRGLGPVVTDTTARMPGDTSKDYIDTGIVRKPGDTGKTVKASVKKAGAVVGPTFSPASASNLLASPEAESYRAGLRLYNSRSYEDAIKAFFELIQQFPQGRFRDNALYWIGESYFAIAEYPAAIVAFEKVLLIKGSSKADDAQYKIGMTYLKMGKAAEAKEALSRLIAQYPESDCVVRARKYLKTIQ